MPEGQGTTRTERPAVTSDALESPEFEALLQTLRTATAIIGTTDSLLRSAGSGLSTREWDALVFLVAYGELRPSEMLRHLTLTHSPQTLSSIIDRLEARSLAERRPHDSDPRAVLVSVTEEGEQLIAELYPLVYRRVVEQFASPYTDEEAAQLNELLARQHTRLD